jgi:hypothetical protein
MTPRTPQCKVFWALLSSSEHSRVPEDSKPPTFPSVGLHPHTWPKWGCDNLCFDYNTTTYNLININIHQLFISSSYVFHFELFKMLWECYFKFQKSFLKSKGKGVMKKQQKK